MSHKVFGLETKFLANVALALPLVFSPSAAFAQTYLADTIEINDATANGPTLANVDNYGSSVASVGDLDGNGTPDLVVGSVGVAGGGSGRGAVDIHFLNSNKTLSSTVRLDANAPNGPTLSDGDLFGSSVVSLGDIDGDQVPDIAVGAIGDDAGGTNRGAVHVFFLNTDGSIKSSVEVNSLTATGLGLSDGDSFGVSITNIGDLDGDGVIDLAVGASGNDTGGSNRGAIHLVFLDVDGTVKSSIKLASGTANLPTLSDGDFLGRSVAYIGDVDGDGVGDLAAGLIYSDVGGEDRGRALILFLNRNGSIKGSAQIDDLTTDGPILQNGDFYGFSVAGMGDLDSDGIPDLAVGAPGDNGSSFSNRGAVHISFLRTDGTVKRTETISDIDLEGPELSDNDLYGTSIAVLADLSGNQLPELLVGAPGDDNSGPNRGAVHISQIPLRFASSATIDETVANGPSIGANHNFGTAIAGLGNLDGIGGEEIAFGSPGAGAGTVQISFLDGTGGIVATTIINAMTTNGPVISSGQRYGASVANIGDLDGDGVSDIAVGAPFSANGMSADEGRVHISFLNSDGSVKSSVSIDGTTPNGPTLTTSDLFGTSVAGLGDLDGDGVEDIVVGAPGDSAVFVLFLDTDGSVLQTRRISSFGGVTGTFGASVANIGDVNGDGVTDIAVGAPSSSVQFGGDGSVGVVFLNTSGTVNGAVEIKGNSLNGPNLLNSEGFGRSIVSVGNLQVPARSALIVGASSLSKPSGTFWYIALAADGLSILSSEQIFDPEQSGSGVPTLAFQANSALYASADLNGDDSFDLLIGAPASEGKGRVYLAEIRALTPPVLSLIGNGVTVANADSTPSTTDGTDFGSAFLTLAPTVRGFTIESYQSVPLELTGTPQVVVSGPNSADFVVTKQPHVVSDLVSAATFQISFAPTGAGLRTATVSIASTDSDQNPFTFAIRGTGVVDGNNDNDGLLDSVDPDDDNDGLSDVQEGMLGTNPLVADTDGDGVSDGQEVGDGTDPLDAGSFIANFGNEVCVEWNGFLSFLAQILEVRNVSQVPIVVDVTLYSITGAAQTPVRLNLAAGIQTDVVVNALSGFTENSFGLVCANVVTGPSNSLGGQLSSYRFTSGSYSLAFASEFLPALSGKQNFTYNTFQPSLNPADTGNFVANWIQVVNDQSSSQTGTLKYYDFEGFEVGSQAVTLGPKARVDVDVHSLGAFKSGLVVWEPTSPSARFRVRQNRYYYGAGGLSDLVDAVALPGKRGTAASLSVPFDTRDRTAALEISNTSSSAIVVSIEVRDEIGTLTGTQPPPVSIPARGTRGLVLNDLLPAGLGNAKLNSATGGLIASLVEYGREVGTGSLLYANPAAPQQSLGKVLIGSYNSFLEQSCRIRVVNSSATAQNATVTMTRFDGTVLLNQFPILIPAKGAKQLSLCNLEDQSAYGQVRLANPTNAVLSAQVIRRNAEGTIEFGSVMQVQDQDG